MAHNAGDELFRFFASPYTQAATANAIPIPKANSNLTISFCYFSIVTQIYSLFLPDYKKAV